MCELYDCPRYEACVTAEEIFTNNGNAVDKHIRTAKLHELQLTQQVMDAVSGECGGIDSDGKCGKDQVASMAIGMIFGAPMTPMSTTVERQIGFFER